MNVEFVGGPQCGEIMAFPGGMVGSPISFDRLQEDGTVVCQVMYRVMSIDDKTGRGIARVVR